MQDTFDRWIQRMTVIAMVATAVALIGTGVALISQRPASPVQHAGR